MSIFKQYISEFVKEEENLRNPILFVNNYKLGFIGDVHIGQTFRTGVPKNRLGEREENILQQFKTLLRRDCAITFVVGDLFHKIRISNNALYQLIKIVEEAVQENPSQEYYILNGNHDMAKETDRVSTFQLFEQYFKDRGYSNLHIISTHSPENIIRLPELLIYCSHYNPFASLDTELEETGLLSEEDMAIPNRIAIGHWETIDFGSDHHIDRNVPDLVLQQFNLVVTGHEHKPKLSLVKDIPVLTTGSMQPYAFGEELEIERQFYTTLSAARVLELLETNPDIFNNSYVRILVQEGDDLPGEFPCLGRTYKNIKVQKDSIDGSEEVALNKPPLSFQASFLEHLKSITTDQNQDLLSNIQRVFLDKAYKDTM